MNMLLRTNNIMQTCPNRGAAIARGLFFGFMAGQILPNYREGNWGFLFLSIALALFILHGHYGYVVSNAFSYVIHAKWRHKS